MRVLLALDGSTSADAARAAVESITWPTGSIVHVLGVIDEETHSTRPVAGTDEQFHDATPRALERVVGAAVASLQAPTLAADGTVAIGRPASIIVAAARERRVELVVVGSRGRGPLASMVLGSVSAEVVDHSPCPVMVVRGAFGEGPLLVAFDGSTSAEAAVTYLVANPILADRRVDIVSVARAGGFDYSWEVGTLSLPALEVLDDERSAYRRDLELSAARAATRLRASGYRVTSTMTEGDAAHQIIERAGDARSDLIVMGSRGMTGLKRLVIGSVARNVLLHAPTSVLIVHEPLREEALEPAAHRQLTGLAAAT